LLFRCWHRGTQESDLILGRFAETHLDNFDNAQLDRLEALLDCTDPDLFDWIIGGFTPPKEYDHDVMRLLRRFARRRTQSITILTDGCTNFRKFLVEGISGPPD